MLNVLFKSCMVSSISAKLQLTFHWLTLYIFLYCLNVGYYRLPCVNRLAGS